MKKGITATSVAIMVVVIMILIGTVTTLSYNSIENAKKIVFSIEISDLQEAVDKYIANEGEYPILVNEYLIKLNGISENSSSQFEGETENVNNEITVYEVDLSILGTTDTIYGNKKTEKDVYVISKTTKRVYYLDGIKSKNSTYYTLTDELLELKDKKTKQEEQISYKTPVITTDGFITKTLSDGTKEVYLTNIQVKNNPKTFKYEIGIIPENSAKEYFKNNGKIISDDRLSFKKRVDVTLYAENEAGDYAVFYCKKSNVILQANAKEAINNGLEIGDKITGYTVTESTISTTGIENTAKLNENTNSFEEVGYQVNNVSSKNFTTWRFIGISENGELEIAPDMIDSNIPGIYLSGKGGYLNGPKVLDELCKKLYSTELGTGRSINVDDITELLGYTGERSSYYDKNDEYVPLSAVLTVGELEGMVGKQIASVHKPDKDTVFECYEVNNYNLYKEQDEEEMEYPERRELVFQSTKYWLASNCIWTYLGSNYVGFGMRYVDAVRMGAYAAFYSFNTPAGTTFAIRPVVALNSNVKIIKNSSENDTWSISLS